MSWFIFWMLLLCIWYALRMNTYHRSWEGLPDFLPSFDIPQTSVSVIIPVRNESSNIPALLSSLEEQAYPTTRWEVIMVDDYSDDDTVQKATPFLQSEKMRFRIIRMNDFFPDTEGWMAHKKMALSVGIGQASGSMIVTTDADCRFQKNWLTTLMLFYEKTGAKMIAAPVKISPVKDWLDTFQAVDFLTLQGITGAVLHTHSHSMCNGANLCYEKSAFTAVDGFDGIDHIASGDDMLLMQKISARFPGAIRFLKSREAIVSTAPATTLNAFIKQRIRWAGKSRHYTEKPLSITLAMVYLLNASFLALAVMACVDRTAGFFFLVFLLGKIMIEYPFVQTVAAFFEEQRQMKWFILLQPLHILYVVVAGGLGLIGSTEWKGRKIQTRVRKTNLD